MTNSSRPSAVFIGETSLLLRCCEAWLARGASIAAIVSGDARISAWAASKRITIGGTVETLAGSSCDYLFSVGNLAVLSGAVLDSARHAAINFHDGPLPSYAGLHVPVWALLAGETRHGVTWHLMTQGIDAGDIVEDEGFDIDPGETSATLNAKCYEAGLVSFERLAGAILDGSVIARPQTGPRRYFGRAHRLPAAGLIDFSKPAADIERIVRALDFGAYENPVGRAKFSIAGLDFTVSQAAVVRADTSASLPGTVLSVDDASIVVATQTQPVRFFGLADAKGKPVDAAAISAIRPGDRVVLTPDAELAAVSEADRLAAAQEHLRAKALAGLSAPELPYPRLAARMPAESGRDRWERMTLDPGRDGIDKAAYVAGFAGWIAAHTGQSSIAIPLTGVRATLPAAQARWFEASAAVVLRRAALGDSDAVRDELERVSADRDLAALDFVARRATPDRALPDFSAWPVSVHFGACEDAERLSPGRDILLVIDEAAAASSVLVNREAYPDIVARTIASQLSDYISRWSSAPGRATLIPVASAFQIGAWNGTTPHLAPFVDVFSAFSKHADAHPDKVAVRCGDDVRSFALVAQQTASLASVLCAKGAGPGKFIGLHLERGADLVVALLAVAATGAAYVPLDPAYPAERLRFMIEDARAHLVLTSPGVAVPGASGVDVVSVDTSSRAPSEDGTSAPSARLPSDLAYLIYTSGSTGQPKGVAVTAGNLASFLAAMDHVVSIDDDSVWLAVTSISFDISVLELIWTMTRGVTIALPAAFEHMYSSLAETARQRIPSLSLFYFAASQAQDTDESYRLLMEGAKIGDRLGFEAVWTPERHFHGFGGPFPNPAVTGAALAAATTTIKIRAGSCVAPLHHPLRIAEDWAVVDRISGGRAGLALASGWAARDFVLAPQNYETRKDVMIDTLTAIRRLWSGEKLRFDDPSGKPVELGSLPTPKRGTIPIWLTAAKSRETFEAAGRLGCNVLTHLLGMTLDEVAGHIRAYRQVWTEAGHAGSGHVTMMLHTYVGESDDAVRAAVRDPMKKYLATAVDLVRAAAWSFPTIARTEQGALPADLAPEDVDAVLDHAFDRYYETSSLLGTPARCRAMAEKVSAAGVDEIACLIDFGVAVDDVLAGLPVLASIMKSDRAAADVMRPAMKTPTPSDLASDIEREKVTHLQCTPSMAVMLLDDADARRSLGRLEMMLVGGEALPADVARRLRPVLGGRLLNMYGPTETTVWSTSCDIAEVDGFIPLGEPLPNTSLVIVGGGGEPLPDYAAGELLIGGSAVTAGYHGRAELTAERFQMIDGPEGPQRMYRTGDLVRRHGDGRLEFLGRSDNQVKIRGHRIELGEIEAALVAIDGVERAVAVGAGEHGAASIVAYVIPSRAGIRIEPAGIIANLAGMLPDVMVPARIEIVASFPMTPNGKIDRSTLSKRVGGSQKVSDVQPMDETERLVQSIWCDILGLQSVGVDRNFFDAGGHSLSAVLLRQRLSVALERDIKLVDLFRHTTIRSFVVALKDDAGQAGRPASTGVQRAEARRARRLASSGGGRRG